MTYRLDMTYRAHINSRSPFSWRASVYPTDEGLRPLTSPGPIVNDVAHMSGVFATERSAILAAGKHTGLRVRSGAEGWLRFA